MFIQPVTELIRHYLTNCDDVMTIITSPDIVVGGLRFYRDSSIFFFRHLPAELTELNSTETNQMLGSKSDLKMHVRNLGHPLP